MAAPARAWPYFSRRPKGTNLIPNEARNTTMSIVLMVTIPNTPATIKTPIRFILAAGYMRMGINGSHGPRINIVKSTHGVILALL